MQDPNPDSLPDYELAEMYNFPVKVGKTVNVPLHAICAYSISILDDMDKEVCKVGLISYKGEDGESYADVEKSFNRAKLVADCLNRANGY